MDCPSIKEFIETANNFVEIIAIVIAGIWTYILFVRQRQKYPRANLVHHITHTCLGDGTIVIHIDVTLSNAGQVLLKITNGKLRIQHVKPVPAEVFDNDPGPFPNGSRREFHWPCDEYPEAWTQAPCEVEPGENNQFHYDVRLKTGAEVVKVYSFYKNAMKRRREIGWNLTTLYDLTAQKQVSHQGPYVGGEKYETSTAGRTERQAGKTGTPETQADSA